jgi:hypothetical protein
MPDHALLKADAAHLDKERRELIKLRDQAGQSAWSKNQHNLRPGCRKPSALTPAGRRVDGFADWTEGPDFTKLSARAAL